MIAILYEDNHLIVINKKPGEIVQGDKTGDQPLLEKVKYYIKNKYNKPGNVYLGLPHRLDRPTSGIVIFCKTSKALTRMNEIFKSKKISKTYWAIVENKPIKESQTIECFLKKNEKQNKSYVVSETTKGAKLARLNYHLIKQFDRFKALEIELLTGRHHQIRAQLSHIGAPIKGDLKYGAKRSNKDGSIHLHSRKISFEHPVKKEAITITAQTPNDPNWKLL